MERLAYNVTEAANAASISRRALYQAMQTGELQYRKRGKRTLILARDLRQFLDAQPLGKPAATTSAA